MGSAQSEGRFTTSLLALCFATHRGPLPFGFMLLPALLPPRLLPIPPIIPCTPFGGTRGTGGNGLLTIFLPPLLLRNPVPPLGVMGVQGVRM